jgi:hypothetical protein
VPDQIPHTHHEVTALLRWARRRGCRLERTGHNHTVVIAPSGARVLVAGTPGSGAAIRTARHQIARALAGTTSSQR